jgi:hypothetical protein
MILPEAEGPFRLQQLQFGKSMKILKVLVPGYQWDVMV